MAIVLEEVKELEKTKEELRKVAVIINNNMDLSKQEKQMQIDYVFEQIYEIDKEIERLKKMQPNVFIQESNKSIIVLAAGIVAIFLIMNRKK